MINTSKLKNRQDLLSAFTLAETLLVLVCVTLFLLFPTLSIKSWNEKIEIEQFLSFFEKNILFTQQLAVINGSDTQILFDEQKRELIFKLNKKNELSKKIVVPKALSASGPKRITFKGSTGNNGNLSKYTFYWKKQQKKIDYQFQLGSGRFDKKVTKL